MMGSLHFFDMMMFDVRQLTTLTLNDLPLFASLCFFYFGYRYFFSNFILKKIGLLLKVKRIETFVPRTFDLVHYSTSALLGLAALSQRPYFHCAFWGLKCRIDIEPTDDPVMSVLEKIYFMMFAAYYLVDALYLGTSNDRLALTCHHFATLSMIFLCIYLNVQTLGIIIMLLHDFVDVPLYLGKICTYLGYNNAKDISLISFAVLCTWFRMINFPTIIYNALLNGISFNNIMPHPNCYWFTWVLLLVLMSLHFYWFSKIVRAVINIFKNGRNAICDTRSD